LFDEGGPPGQTAKLIRLSAAGFDFAVDVGGENQSDASGGDEGGGFAPEGWREYKKQQYSQKKFPHITPRQKICLGFIDDGDTKGSPEIKIPFGPHRSTFCRLLFPHSLQKVKG